MNLNCNGERSYWCCTKTNLYLLTFTGFFEKGDSDDAKAYQKVADAMSSTLKFAHTTQKAVLDKYKYKK